VVGRAVDADDLLLKVRSYSPDVAIVDVRMPPRNLDDGLVAAVEIRRTKPEVGVSSSPAPGTVLRSSWSGERLGVAYLRRTASGTSASFSTPSAVWPAAGRPSTRRW
jgi:DNA-binding NarL/FixJ family response regulator